MGFPRRTGVCNSERYNTVIVFFFFFWKREKEDFKKGERRFKNRGICTRAELWHRVIPTSNLDRYCYIPVYRYYDPSSLV